MFFLIPVGRGTNLVKIPWISISLVLLTCLTYFFTHAEELAYQEHHSSGSALNTIASQLADLSLDDLSPVNELLRKKVASDREHLYFPSLETDTIFSQVNGNTMDSDTPWRQSWNDLYQRYNQLKIDYSANGIPLESIYRNYAFIPSDQIFPGILTHMFLHAGLGHLFFNMLFLWLVGAGIEERWGPVIFPGLYFSGGVISALIGHQFQPIGPMGAIGASGAVSTIMGAFLIRHTKMPIRMFYLSFLGFQPRTGFFFAPAWSMLLLWVLQQMFWILMGPSANTSNTGYVTHLAGFIFGASAGLVISKTNWASAWEHAAESTTEGESMAMEKAEHLFQSGQVKEAQKIYSDFSVQHPSSLPALLGLLKTHDYLDDKSPCAMLAAKSIVCATKSGKLHQAGELYDTWKQTLHAGIIPDQLIISLAQSLTVLERYHDALIWYGELGRRTPNSAYIGKAIFSSGKIFKDYLHQSKNAETCFKRLMRPPYQTEWELIAQQELLDGGKS